MYSLGKEKISSPLSTYHQITVNENVGKSSLARTDDVGAVAKVTKENLEILTLWDEQGYIFFKKPETIPYGKEMKLTKFLNFSEVLKKKLGSFLLLLY